MTKSREEERRGEMRGEERRGEMRGEERRGRNDPCPSCNLTSSSRA